MRHRRALWLIGVGMLMFTGGVAVIVTAKSTSDNILGAIAVLGALAVVVANFDRSNGRDGG